MKRVCTILFFCLLLADPALAQSDAVTATAREVAIQGIEAYDAGDYKLAAEKLTQSYGMVKVPTTALYLARALQNTGRLVEAYVVYQEASTMEVAPTLAEAKRAAQESAKASAALELEKLIPQLPRLQVEVRGVDPTSVVFSVDGSEVPGPALAAGQFVNPGLHHVVGRSGTQEVAGEARVAVGASTKVVLDFAPRESVRASPGDTPSGVRVAPPPPLSTSAPPPDRPRRSPVKTAGFIVLAAGGGAVLGGVGVGLLAMDKRSELDDSGCVKSKCDPSLESDVSSYNSLREGATGLFALGAAGVITGTTLIVAAPRRSASTPPRSGIRPWVGLGQAGVKGVF